MIKKTIFLLISIIATNNEYAVAELLKDQIFNSNGTKRTYDAYLPNKLTEKLRPLVLLLHGHVGSADVMTGENKKSAPYKIWLSIAEREGWVLLIPDGEFGSDNYRGWNDCRKNATTNPTTDDVSFLTNLIDAFSEEHPINKNRIYVHGTSNGGNMALRLAQESGEKFQAIAAIVASMPGENKCKESKDPISILIMNGTDDPILPYLGGYIGLRKSDKVKRGSVISTSETIQYWLNNNGITSKPKVRILEDKNKRDRSTIRIEQYFGESNNTEVILYKMIGAGHTEPSLSEHYGMIYKLIVGKQNKDIEMAEEVWKFFERNRYLIK